MMEREIHTTVNLSESGGRLSPSEYWNTVLSRANLPRINQYDSYFISMNFFDSILGKENKNTFMEIGAGSSGWLPYFAKKYGYLVSGLDYSELGCKIAEENLKILNIPFDQILCKDVFEWDKGKRYDVIFSYGVIEHFENPEKLLKICYDRLNDNGIIITLVPNLQGLMGWFSRTFVFNIHKMHKVISSEELRNMHLNVGFVPIVTRYVGTFFPGVIAWANSDSYLFTPETLRRFILLKMISLISRVLNAFFRTFRIEIPTRTFSPYVVSVMRRVNESNA